MHYGVTILTVSIVDQHRHLHSQRLKQIGSD
jgi:hypothetical protein